MVQNIVGTVPRGEDCYGRDSFISNLWENLKTSNIILASPRRFGKTSIMYHVLDNPREGFEVIHLDLEATKEPAEFIINLIEKINENAKLRNFFIKGLKGINKILHDLDISIPIDEKIQVKIKLKEDLKKTWQKTGGQILEKIQSMEDNYIIIFDEFSIMISNFLDGRLPENEVREFLNWFRKLRIDPKNTKCRFLIGSSISMDSHLSRLNCIASFNDFEKLVLKEFEENAIALSFITKLCESSGIRLSLDSKNKMLELIGPPIPYFIQIFISILRNKYSHKRLNISSKDIIDIYNNEVLGVMCKSYFQHYYDRLRYYEPKIEKSAKNILRNLAIEGEIKKSILYQRFLETGASDTQIDDFTNLMTNLENDFYIVYKYTDESYIFFSKILRDWWKRYYSL